MVNNKSTYKQCSHSLQLRAGCSYMFMGFGLLMLLGLDWFQCWLLGRCVGCFMTFLTSCAFVNPCADALGYLECHSV